jgi:DNA-binding transcriptional LysR family regulator
MPLRFSLRQLEYLEAVADCGSIAAAAQRANVSLPSISSAISQLEADLGLQLFVRRHVHGLSPTPAGLQLLAQARRVLAEASRLVSLAHDVTGEMRGPLNVGCLLTFAQIVLPLVRRRFVDRFPDVEFRQFERSQTELIDGLRKASLDIALTYDMGLPDDLDFRPLVTLPPYVLIGATHALAGRKSVTARDLAALPMILLDLPMSADYFLSIFAKTGLQPRIVERTRDIAVMQSLVANGFGYSLANIRPVPDRAPDGGALCHVPLTGQHRPLRMGLLQSGSARPTLVVKTFAEHCRSIIAG